MSYNIGLNVLSTFIVVADSKNLEEAADTLCITRAAVSARLNQLEGIVGKDLLMKGKHGSVLTKDGALFYRYARLILSLWSHTLRQIDLPKNFTSSCTIGCESSLWNILVEDFVVDLRENQSDIALAFQTGGNKDINLSLDNSAIDIGFTFNLQKEYPGYTKRHLGDDWLVQVSKEKRSIIEWDFNYIYTDMGEAFHRQHSISYPVDQKAAITFNDSRMTLDYILKNGGSSYLPWRLVENHIKAAELYIVEGTPYFKRDVYFLVDETREMEWPWLKPMLDGLAARLAHMKPPSADVMAAECAPLPRSKADVDRES